MLTIVSGMLVSASLQAQTLKRQTPGLPGMYPAIMDFEDNAQPIFQKGVALMPNAKGALVRTTNLAAISSEKDALGQEHIRYQQTFQGIPIEHAVLIQHVVNNKVLRQNGKMVEDFDTKLSVSPSLSEASALSAALAYINAKVYKWQLSGEEAFIKTEQNDSKATFYPKGSLVLYSGEEEVVPSALRLAYKFDIYAQEPMSRQIVFVDAKTGSILGRREMIHEANAVGSAVTGFSGTQTITADSYNGAYRLRETGRGSGIQTFNLNRGTNYNSATDFTDADNTWNNVNANRDQYATDAHWGAEKTYDYFKVKYNRNSIDNAGFAIKSYVHYSTNYFNAFWDGSRMTYGDGDASDGNKPLTAIDVCGHEISHGLTSFTSNLTYSGESGAMNEGFSDIFGTAIEFYARPGNANWLVGSDFYTIRSMSNPNAYSNPDTYLGTYWYSGSGDNGGVHTNSGVLNYWFYLLSVGGSGTNDKGAAFNVTGLGIDKAAAIAFRTNTVYLISTSKYTNARTLSIQAATDLYGAGSAEVTQTTNAWNAVNVGVVVVPPTCTDNYETNETIATAKTIPVNASITAKIGSSTDKDYFKFSTTAASPKVKINLSSLPADYDVRLYNSAGTQIGISQAGGTNAEAITYNTATTAATYTVYVYGYNGVSSTACYSLLASISGTNFFDDGEEEGEGLISMTNTVNAGFKAGPVPASDFTTLTFTSKIAGKAELNVASISGAMVNRVAIPATSGSNQYRLNVSGLKNGMYILKLNIAGSTQVQKILVQH